MPFPIVTFDFIENLSASQFAFLQIMRLENEFSAYKVRAHALLQKKDAELAEAKNSELLKSLEQAVKVFNFFIFYFNSPLTSLKLFSKLLAAHYLGS